MTEKRVKRIIKLRENAKDEMELEIKRARTELDNERERLNSIESSIEKMQSGFHASGSIVNPLELELFYNSFYELHKEASEQKEEIRLLEEDLEGKKTKAVEINREKKLLDILVKRLIKERLTKASRDEQREIDFDFISRRLRE